jgi:hypothetical protein
MDEKQTEDKPMNTATADRLDIALKLIAYIEKKYNGQDMVSAIEFAKAMDTQIGHMFATYQDAIDYYYAD